MSGYVIKRASEDGGGYVTPAGSLKSYTPALQRARVFPTREAAEADRCPDNERVVPVEDELQGRDR